MQIPSLLILITDILLGEDNAGCLENKAILPLDPIQSGSRVMWYISNCNCTNRLNNRYLVGHTEERDAVY